jgi:hypothetical protein
MIRMAVVAIWAPDGDPNTVDQVFDGAITAMAEQLEEDGYVLTSRDLPVRTPNRRLKVWDWDRAQDVIIGTVEDLDGAVHLVQAEWAQDGPPFPLSID